jgi:hypothetical protein
MYTRAASSINAIIILFDGENISFDACTEPGFDGLKKDEVGYIIRIY